MAKGYWFINLDVVNPVSFLTYAEANLAFGIKHGLHFVIAGGDFEQMEGIKRHRNLLVECPSYDAAVNLHASSEYGDVVRQRQDSCIADVVAVEGYEGEQAAAVPPPEGRPGFPRGYWMSRVDVTDPELFKEYAVVAREALAEYGAWYLVRGGRHQLLEGKGRSRYVVAAFPDVATARACYFSLPYQRALAIRQKSAQADFLIIAGAEGPMGAQR